MLRGLFEAGVDLINSARGVERVRAGGDTLDELDKRAQALQEKMEAK